MANLTRLIAASSPSATIAVMTNFAQILIASADRGTTVNTTGAPRATGASGRPVFPAPFFRRGREDEQGSGKTGRENAMSRLLEVRTQNIGRPRAEAARRVPGPGALPGEE